MASKSGAPRMFRVMIPVPGTIAVPLIARSARGLGVRVPPDPNPDILPDAHGQVGPGGKGMSVSPSLEHLPYFRVPARLRHLVPGARGIAGDRVFRMGEASFAARPVTPGIELVPDRPGHGVVQPSDKMTLAAYEGELASTQALWSIDEGV